MKIGDMNMKRIWRSFEIPDYEKNFGKNTGKGFKNQMFDGTPGGYKKVSKKSK